MSATTSKIQALHDVKCQTRTDSLLRGVHSLRVKCCHKHLVMWFNSKEMLTANTQVQYKWMWTYCPWIQAVSSLASNLPRHNSRSGHCGCRHQSSCDTLRGRALHLHPASISPGGKVTAKEPSRFPGLQRSNLFRVITYFHTLTFPPSCSNTVVPGKCSVQSHRLVILTLEKSHCTVFIC